MECQVDTMDFLREKHSLRKPPHAFGSELVKRSETGKAYTLYINLPHLSCMSSSSSSSAAVLRCLWGLELSCPDAGPEHTCMHIAIQNNIASISIGSSSGMVSNSKPTKSGEIWPLNHLPQQVEMRQQTEDAAQYQIFQNTLLSNL